MCAGLGAGVVVHDGVVLGRDEVTPTMPLVGPLPECVPWAVVVTVSARADRCVPLVLAEASRADSFANAVTPTTPRWGLPRCVGAQHHATRPRQRYDLGAFTRVRSESFSRPSVILQLGGAFGVKKGCGVGAARVIRDGRAARVHGQCVGAVSEVFSRRILRQVPSSQPRRR